MKKRFAALLLAAVLLISLAPAAFAAKPIIEPPAVTLTNANIYSIGYTATWNRVAVYTFAAYARLKDPSVPGDNWVSDSNLSYMLSFGKRTSAAIVSGEIILTGTTNLKWPDDFYGKEVMIYVQLLDKKGKVIGEAYSGTRTLPLAE